MNPKVILFDVNETLMDMSPLKKKLNKLLDSKRGFRIWFGMLLQYSLVDNSTGQYHDFATIGNAVLDMAATAMGQKLVEKKKKEVLALMKQLEAHADIKEGLMMLKDAGFRLATLTNSPPQTLSGQLQHAGITDYFEHTLSVDAVGKYKPAPEPYHYAAQVLGVNPGDVMMVAAHGWDIAGALNAGLQAAFIARKGQALYPLAPKPKFTGSTLLDVAKKIIEQQSRAK